MPFETKIMCAVGLAGIIAVLIYAYRTDPLRKKKRAKT
jgi:hypothetical protein